jgi:zinc and cadmium transporter
MLPLLLSVLAAIGFVGATLLVDTAFGTSRTFHHLSVVIAAGILLGVAFADLIPETLELLTTTRAAISIAIGFLVLFLVESLTSGHTHHHEPHAHGHAHAHAHSHGPAADSDGCVPRHAIVPFLVGLSIHNLADGMVIAASDEVSDAASSGVALGILIHQLPVGLSFAAVLIASDLPVGRVIRDALLVGAMIPLGALVVLAVPDPSSTMLGTIIGISAGALLYIASGHLLPEAQSEHRRPGIAAAFATALLGTVLFIGAFHDHAHGHAEHDDHEGAEHADDSEHEHDHA